MEGIDKNTFKKIFHDHWDAFKQFRPRFDNPDYNETVNKMLGCGDPDKMALFNTDAATVEKYAELLSPASPPFVFPVPRFIPTAGQTLSPDDCCPASLIAMWY